MIFVLCQRWMPCRGGGGGGRREDGGVGWRGGGVAKYNGVCASAVENVLGVAVALCVAG